MYRFVIYEIRDREGSDKEKRPKRCKVIVWAIVESFFPISSCFLMLINILLHGYIVIYEIYDREARGDGEKGRLGL